MSYLRAIPFALIVASASATATSAAEVRKFDRASFGAAQAQGRPILLDVKAWWCPVCASQSRTIKSALTDHKYDKLVIFEINYDTQKPEWQSFGVNRQATLIAFKGTHPSGRLDFVTDKDQITGLLNALVS
jgi:thioredoxin-like negative regulator of GroEL